MQRQPEPELMDLSDEVTAYAHAGFAEVNQRFVDRLLELAGDRAGGACVDLGCGPGDITMRLARARPGWQITGVDASVPMLQWAKNAAAEAKLTERICFRLADVKSLPFADAAFDIICSNSLLHHITDAVAVWKQIKRIARPGATIFLRDLYRPPDPATARRIIDTHAAGESELLREEFHRSLLSAYSPEEIRDQLHVAGLDHLSVRVVNDRHVDVFSLTA